MKTGRQTQEVQRLQKVGPWRAGRVLWRCRQMTCTGVAYISPKQENLKMILTPAASK